MLLWLGFEERSRGSHHVFVKLGIRELMNLQREGNLARPYQVKQVRIIIRSYGLGVEEETDA